MKRPIDVLRELRSGGKDGDIWRPDPVRGSVADGPVRSERVRAIGWRIYSKLLRRELWICIDEDAAAEIAAESTGLPALTIDEALSLRGKPTELIAAILNVKVQFPEARLRS